MKRKYEIKPTTANERVGRGFLRGLTYVAVFAAGIYTGHSCDMSKIRNYSISDAEKDVKKVEKKVGHEKDSFLDGLVDRIERLKK